MRQEGWESKHYSYLAMSRQLAFEWGVYDCCLWVARHVDSITGSDHVSEWEGLYNTADGAQACMESKGFSSPQDIADRYLREIPLSMAKRGDIVLHPAGALGICDGRKSHFLLETVGFTSIDTLKCRMAWEV